MARKTPALFLILTIAVAIAQPARGATPLAQGDILAAMYTPGAGFPIGRLIAFYSNGTQEIWVPDHSTGPYSVSIATTTNVLVGEAFSVLRYDTSGNPQGIAFPIGGVQDVAYDRAGFTYLASTTGVYKMSPNGTLAATLSIPFLPNGIQSLDLASDDCTLYYTPVASTRIARWNACSDTALPDLANVPSAQAHVARILPDNTILVSAETATYRYTTAGTLQQTYSIPATTGMIGLALAPDAQTFWVTANGGIARIDGSTGALITGPIFHTGPPPITSINSLSVMGEFRAALAPASIPAVSPLGLLALACGLGIIATIALRQ